VIKELYDRRVRDFARNPPRVEFAGREQRRRGAMRRPLQRPSVNLGARSAFFMPWG